MIYYVCSKKKRRFSPAGFCLYGQYFIENDGSLMEGWRGHPFIVFNNF